jgi:hypothetical protein
LQRPFTALEKYRVVPEMHRDKVIAVGYLQRRLLSKASFQNDKIGATNALTRALKNLQNEGSIRELRQVDVLNHYGKSMSSFLITDIYRFVER